MTMGKFISNLFLGLLAIGLSIFTASRTLDLLAWALPASQVIMQWLGLAAFEGGMYFWAFFFVAGAKGTPQRAISLCMAVFSVIAVCVATIADLSLDAGEAGKIAPLTPAYQQAMIIFVGLAVALNVAAFLSCHLLSPENMRSIKAGQAEDMIYTEGLRAIEAVAPQMAADAAPHLAAEWSNRTWQRIVPGIPRNTQYLGPVGAAVPALPAGNFEPLPLQSPTHSAPAQPAPVVPSQAPAKKPGLLAKAKGFLLGDGAQESMTLSQTDAIPALEPAAKPVTAYASYGPADQTAQYLATHRPTRLPRNSHASVAQARRARRVARFQPQAQPARESAPAPDEHRTCSECGGVLDLKNAKQLTCGDVCRKRRTRRLAAERKVRKQGE